MPKPNENLLKLHTNLTEKWQGFSVPFEQFEKDMQDETKVKRLHDNLSKNWKGFTVPYEQFKTDIGYDVAPVRVDNTAPGIAPVKSTSEGYGSDREKMSALNPDGTDKRGWDDAAISGIKSGLAGLKSGITTLAEKALPYMDITGNNLFDESEQKQIHDKATQIRESAPQRPEDLTGAEGLAWSIGEFVPQMVGIVAATASAPFTAGTSLAAVPSVIGGANIAMLVGSSMGSAMNTYEEYMKESGQETNEAEMWGVGIASGAAEYFAEKLGTFNRFIPKGAIPKAVSKMFSEGGQEAAQGMFKQFAKGDEFLNLVKKYGWNAIKHSGEEGFEEVATELGNIAIEYGYKGVEDGPGWSETWDRIKQAGEGGALMGGIVSPVSTWSKSAVAKKARQQNGFVTLIQDNSGKAYEAIQKTKDGYIAIDTSGKETILKEEDVDVVSKFSLKDFDKFTNMAKQGKAVGKELEASAALQFEFDNIDKDVLNRMYRGDEQFPSLVNGVEEKDPDVVITAKTQDGTQYQIISGSVNSPDAANPMVGVNLQTGEKRMLSDKDVGQVDILPASQMRSEMRMEAETRVKSKYKLESLASDVADKYQPGDLATFNGQQVEIVDVTDPSQGVTVKIVDAKGGEQVVTLAPDQLSALQPVGGVKTSTGEVTPAKTWTVGKKQFTYTEKEDGTLFVPFKDGKDETKAITAEVDDTQFDVIPVVEEVPIPNAPPFAKKKTQTVVKGVNIVPKQVNGTDTQAAVEQPIQSVEAETKAEEPQSVETGVQPSVDAVGEVGTGTADAVLETQQSNYGTMAADYLLTGGVGSVLSSDYLLQGIGGIFTKASREINAIRNKYTQEINALSQADVKNFANTELYNKIMSEISTAINQAYNNNSEVQSIFNQIIQNPTGLPVKTGNQISIRIDEINSANETNQPVTNQEVTNEAPPVVEQTTADGQGETPAVSPVAENVQGEPDKAIVKRTIDVFNKMVSEGKDANILLGKLKLNLETEKAGRIWESGSSFTENKTREQNISNLEASINEIEKSFANTPSGTNQPQTPEVAPEQVQKEYESKTVEELVALKKEKYSNPDIESAMTDDEKVLNKVIAAKYSEINKAIRDKRNKNITPASPTPASPVVNEQAAGVNGEVTMAEERKQRILNEGSGFDKKFGLTPVKDIKSADDVISNIDKILSTLKANAGNGKYKSFEGFASDKNYSKNAGDQVREYFIALDVLPNELRKEFADKIKATTHQELSDWAAKRYKDLTIPKSVELKPTTAGQKLEQMLADDKAKKKAEELTKAAKLKAAKEKAKAEKAKRDALNLEEGEDAYTVSNRLVESGEVELEDMREMTTTDMVAKYSENPLEILEELSNVDHYIPESELDAKEVAIAKHMAKVPAESVYKFGDRNAVGMSMARAYFAKKGQPSQTLDQIAQQASGEFDREDAITTKDVWEFMLRYPNGAESLLKQITPEYKALKERFNVVAGVDVTKALIDKGVAIVKARQQGNVVSDDDFDWGQDIEDTLGDNPADELQDGVDKFNEQPIDNEDANNVNLQDENDQREDASPGGIGQDGIQEVLPEEVRPEAGKPLQGEGESDRKRQIADLESQISRTKARLSLATSEYNRLNKAYIKSKPNKQAGMDDKFIAGSDVIDFGDGAELAKQVQDAERRVKSITAELNALEDKLAALNVVSDNQMGLFGEEMPEEMPIDIQEQPAQTTTFKYRLLYRPANEGFPANGFTGYEEDGTKYGLLVYNRELTPDEIRSYELEPVVDINEYVGKDVVYYEEGEQKFYATVSSVGYRNKVWIQLDKKDEKGEVMEREQMLPYEFLARIKSGELYVESEQPIKPKFAGEKLEQILSKDKENPPADAPEIEKPTPPTPPKPKDYGKSNKVFTEDAAAKARAALKAKFGNLNAGIDPETMMNGITLAGFHIEAGARKFADYARAMIEDAGNGIKPYLKSFYEGIRNWPGFNQEGLDSQEFVSTFDIENFNTQDDVLDRPGSGQPDSPISPDEVPANESPVPNDGGESGQVGNEPKKGSNKTGGRRGGKGGSGLFTSLFGEPSDNEVYQQDEEPGIENNDAGDFDGRGSRNDGAGGYINDNPGAEEESDPEDQRVSESFKERTRQRIIQQKKVENVPVQLMDEANIRETLPVLLPEQQDDVLKAERRFFGEQHKTKELANGKGMLFTNGTGTGKTFTGLGIIKRFAKQGKNNILIVVPSEAKVNDWIKDAEALGLKVTVLKNTKDKGQGINITTYATFRANENLKNRDLDLIVYDESHRIMEEKKGTASATTFTHYQMANTSVRNALDRITSVHPVWVQYNAAYDRYKSLNKSLNNDQSANPQQDEADVKAVSKVLDELSAKKKELLPSLTERAEKAFENTKVVFLSATPFKGHFNLRYAKGSLINWDEETVVNNRGSRVDGESRFFLENFGSAYEWKYHRLQVKEAANAEAIAMQEVEFAEKLMRQGVMSGRAIESDKDYSREFPLVALENSEVINRAYNDIYNRESEEFSMLRGATEKVFSDYQYKTRLFESLKASMLLPRIEKHLALGRKVVVFHRRKQANVEPPFALILRTTKLNATATLNDNNATEEQKTNAALALQQVDAFEEKYSDLLAYEQTLNYSSAIDQIVEKFGTDRVVQINGDISKKDKPANIEKFNDDNSGVDIIIVQEEAGKEGISLHDTSGKHQRVLMSLSLPISSTTALQIEGRIFRIGQETDAIFENPLLGLDMEVAAFGQTVNKKLSTTENLAIGNQARDLLRSFAEGVLFNSSQDDPNTNQGRGGKEYDKKAQETLSEFRKAVLVYNTNQKTTGKRDQREGVDYFATPEPVGQKMVEWLDINEGESVLEPSAGHGAIAMWFPEKSAATVVEPSYSLFSKLSARAGGGTRKLINDIFENLNLVNKFHGIAMNPPFGSGGKTAMDHVEKAFNHLKNGGRLVALIPNGGSMDKRLEQFLYGTDENGKQLNPDAQLVASIKLPSVTFKQAGTSVSSRIVVIDRVEIKTLTQFVNEVSKEQNNNYLRGKQVLNADAIKVEAQIRYNAQQARIPDPDNIDLAYIDKIDDLFDAIEDIDLPKKRVQSGTESTPQASPAAVKDDGVRLDVKYQLVTVKHTKTGEDLFIVRMPNKVSDNEYREISTKAKAAGGFWDKFSKGFRFSSVEDRQKFVDNAFAFKDDNEIKFKQQQDTQDNDTPLTPFIKRADELRQRSDRAKELGKQFGVPVKVITNRNQLPERILRRMAAGRLYPGVYYGRTGQIYVLVGEVTDMAEVEKTIAHEVVAHKGLREMLGKDEFDAMIANVYKDMDNMDIAFIRKQYTTKDHTPTNAEIADEYIASLAETGNFPSWFGRVIAKVRSMLRRNGFTVTFTDADIMYLLWESQRRLLKNAGAAGYVQYKDKEGDVMENVRFSVSAFHGSPHSFDRFSTEYIGTGEGAQAYGWGMYFTTKKGIAEEYAKTLGKKSTSPNMYGVDVNNVDYIKIGSKKLGTVQSDILDTYFFNFKFTYQQNQPDLGELKEKARFIKTDKSYQGADAIQKIADYILNAESVEIKYTGDSRHLYTVSLHPGKTPDQYDYLRWDKEIEPDQLDKIYKALEKEEGIPYGEMELGGATLKNKTGENIYRDLVKYYEELAGESYPIWWGKNDSASDKQASQFLLRAGIDGIQYPAEYLSKGTHEDAYNYVIFDENAVQIEDHIRFKIIGEQGAANLDMSEEATTRLDNLKVAREMEAAGKDAKTILLATGWQMGKDGKWRYETPDDITIKSFPQVAEGEDKLTTFGELFDSPSLFAAYPQIKDMTVFLVNEPNTGFFGEYVYGAKILRLNTYESNRLHEGDLYKRNRPIRTKSTDQTRDDNADVLGRTIIHEIQHSIQNIEGFAGGGRASDIFKQNPDFVLQRAMDNGRVGKPEESKEMYDAGIRAEAFSIYNSLPGEVEARNAASRMNMTPEERRNTLISETEDVAREDQILLTKYLQANEITYPKAEAIKNKISESSPYYKRNRQSATELQPIEEWDREQLPRYAEKLKSLVSKRYDNKQYISHEEAADLAFIYGELSKYKYQDVSLEELYKALKIAADFGYYKLSTTAINELRGMGIVVNEPIQPLLPPTITVNGKPRPTTNSKGQPIHPTIEGVENFWKWFGDSKVVDAEGRPLVVYHGGSAGITEFDPDKAGSVNYADWGKGIYFTPAKWMADGYREDAVLKTDKEGDRLYEAMEKRAKELGTTPMNVSIDLGFQSPGYNEISALRQKWTEHRKNVALNGGGEVYEAYLKIDNPLIHRYEEMTDPFLSDAAKHYGNDGIIVTPMTEYVVFSPNQIKSATGNDGSFDPDNADIRFKIGDESLPLDEKTEGMEITTLNNYDVVNAGLEVNEDIDKDKFAEAIFKKLNVPFTKKVANTGTIYYTFETSDGDTFTLRYANHSKGINGRYADRKTDGNVVYSEGDSLYDISERLRDELPDGKIITEIPNQSPQSNSNIRFRISPSNTPSLDPVMVEGKREKFRENVQDKMLAAKNMQETVTKRGGLVPQSADGYNAENRSQSRSMAMITNFNNTEIDQLNTTLAEIVFKHEQDLKTVNTYLLAKSSLERNNEEGTKALNDDVNGAWGQVEVDQIIADFEAAVPPAVVNQLWKDIKAATDFAIKTLYMGNVIGKDAYNAMKARKYYVPLKSWDFSDTDNPVDFYNYAQGERTAYQGLHKAHGRGSKAADPLAYIESAAHSAVVSANKNMVKHKFLMLARMNPNMKDLFNIKKIYLMEKGEDADGNPIYVNVIKDGEDAFSINGFQSNGEPILVNEGTFSELYEDGKIVSKISRQHMTRRPSYLAKQHEVEVMENGERYIIAFGDPNVANSINGALTNVEVLARSFQQSRLGKPFSQFMRWVTAGFTAKNPAFIPINWMRDMGYSSMSHLIRKDGDLKGFISNYPAGMKAIHRYLAGTAEPGSNKFDQLYEQFRLFGGETGFVHLKEIKDLTKDISREVNRKGGKRDGWDKVSQNRAYKAAGGLLDYMAIISENSARFATFLASVEGGKSFEQAASDAKNISVNFNRKGRITGLAGTFYGFFNASVQGADNFLEMSIKNKKNMAIAATSFFAAGLLLSEMLKAIGPDDEDGKNAYEQLPEWVRKSNLCIPDFINGGFFTIPLPFVFREIYGAGVTLSDIAHGTKPAGEGLFDTFSGMFSAFSPIAVNANELRAGKPPLRTIIPTLLTPIYDNIVNQDFTGRQVYKVPFTKEQERYTPNSELGAYNVNHLLEGIAKGLNKLGGGNEYTPAGMTPDSKGNVNPSFVKRSIFDWNPSKTEHLLEYYLGGRGRFVNDIYKTAEAAISSEKDVQSYNIPVLKRLYTKPYKGDYWTEYMEIRQEVRDFNHYLKAAENNRDFQTMQEMLTNTRMRIVSDMFKDRDEMIKEYTELIQIIPDIEGKKTARDAREQAIKTFVEQTHKIEEITKQPN